eukprot:763775-Hanusia_phi.AAC.1
MREKYQVEERGGKQGGRRWRRRREGREENEEYERIEMQSGRCSSRSLWWTAALRSTRASSHVLPSERRERMRGVEGQDEWRKEEREGEGR